MPTFPKAVQPLLSFANIAHALEFAVLSFLLARAFKNSKNDVCKKYFRIFAIMCAIVYGISDELHQHFVPLRHPSFIDLVYDSIGALIGHMFFKEKNNG